MNRAAIPPTKAINSSCLLLKKVAYSNPSCLAVVHTINHPSISFPFLPYHFQLTGAYYPCTLIYLPDSYETPEYLLRNTPVLHIEEKLPNTDQVCSESLPDINAYRKLLILSGISILSHVQHLTILESMFFQYPFKLKFRFFQHLSESDIVCKWIFP